jgi:hypothetical protein
MHGGVTPGCASPPPAPPIPPACNSACLDARGSPSMPCTVCVCLSVSRGHVGGFAQVTSFVSSRPRGTSRWCPKVCQRPALARVPAVSMQAVYRIHDVAYREGHACVDTLPCKIRTVCDIYAWRVLQGGACVSGHPSLPVRYRTPLPVRYTVCVRLYWYGVSNLHGGGWAVTKGGQSTAWGRDIQRLVDALHVVDSWDADM